MNKATTFPLDNVATIAIDLAKNVFQVGAEDARGKELWQRRLKREPFFDFVRMLEPPLLVCMEVGPGAQAWARQLQGQGVTVKLLPAARVKDHRNGGDKNDIKDTRAILRASHDESIHPVPVKRVERLTLQALHRARAGWRKRGVAIVNQCRGLLLEHGVVMSKGVAKFAHELPARLEDATQPIPDRLRELLEVLFREWQSLQTMVTALDKRFDELSRADPDANRLLAIPGIGPLASTAIACKELDPKNFRSGRDFAAYFGGVPRQHSSGEIVRLGRMSHHGDRYVFSLLVIGAHSALNQLKDDDHSVHAQRQRRWIERHGRKGAAIRLANHNLRVIWALMRYGTVYQRGRRAKREVPILTS